MLYPTSNFLRVKYIAPNHVQAPSTRAFAEQAFDLNINKTNCKIVLSCYWGISIAAGHTKYRLKLFNSKSKQNKSMKTTTRPTTDHCNQNVTKLQYCSSKF